MANLAYQVLIKEKATIKIWLGVPAEALNVADSTLMDQWNDSQGGSFEKGGLTLEFLNSAVTEEVGLGVSIFTLRVEDGAVEIDLNELMRETEELLPKLKEIFMEEYFIFEEPSLHIQIEKD